jgi:hydrophobic/amphiphilic exporter-1 (mainly G- bacteria), HAE1 family
MNRAIAGVIVGGQTLSLLLTLLAPPVTYSLLDDLGAWLARPRGQPHDKARRRHRAVLPLRRAAAHSSSA